MSSDPRLLRTAAASIWADLQSRGVWPFLTTDLNELAAVNAALVADRANDWYPLMPMCDPSREPGGQALCIIARDASGAVAGAVASRLRHLPGSVVDSFGDASYFTAAPLAGASVGAVSAPDGKPLLDADLQRMRGPVAVIGAGYVHPRFRAAGLARPLFAAAALLSALYWAAARHAMCVTRARDEIRLGVRTLGFPRTHGLITVHDPRWESTSGAHEIAVMSMSRADVLADAARIIAAKDEKQNGQSLAGLPAH